MAHPPSSATSARPPSGAPRSSSSPIAFGPEDFPGCEPFQLPASELEGYEGRLEFWDGHTETAWRYPDPPPYREPPTYPGVSAIRSTPTYHESPAWTLASLTEELAMLRGSEIACLGSSSLVRRDASGAARWAMQADEVLYLRPSLTQPHGPVIDVDVDVLPDVVLEVDYVTDVRRRKLSIYEEGGFPEVWVLVPPESPVNWPGLTIHVLDDGGYREASQSAAILGWQTPEIFQALTEIPMPEPASRALARVALAMGVRAGTFPEDNPEMRALMQGWKRKSARDTYAAIQRRLRANGRRDAYWKGHGEGFAIGLGKGRAEGYEESHREGCAAMALALLRSRGIEVSPTSTEDLLAPFADLTPDALLEAVQACTDEADCLRRIREAAG